MESTCPRCGEQKQNLGSHWARSQSCGYPDLTRDQLDTIRGILFTRGGITTRNGTGKFTYEATDKEKVWWVAHQLGWLASNVSQCEQDSMGDAAKHGDEYEWKDTYRVSTYSHPELLRIYHDFRTTAGESIVPDSLDQTSQLLRTIYASCGSLLSDRGNRVQIPASKTKPSKSTVRSVFAGFGPVIEDEKETYRIVLNNTTDFFHYIGWEPISFTDWPDSPNMICEPDQQCPDCGARTAQLGSHLRYADCSPELSPTQQAVSLAIASSSAQFKPKDSDEQPGRTSMVLNSSNEEVLQCIRQKLDWVASSITTVATSETVEENLEKGFGATPRSTSDAYRVRTIRLPQFVEYRDRAVDNQLFTLLQTSRMDEEYFRVLFALYGRVKDGKPMMATTYWSLSEEEIYDVFSIFDPVVYQDTDTRYVRLDNVDAFKQVLGEDAFPGQIEIWNTLFRES